ncbi:MAG: hydrogenase maturation protease [Terriglobales bacterium]
MNHKVLVACVGNVFLGDDAFGVEVAKRLAGRPLPAGVSVTDFGIRSYDLAYALMNDWDLKILVDALPRGGNPGTIYVMEPEVPSNVSQEALDAHSMNPVAVLQLVGALGGEVGRLLVVGCEPETVEPSAEGEMGLSGPVDAAVEEAVRVIEGLIANNGRQVMAA